MMVRCCRTYEEVSEGDIGRVIKVSFLLLNQLILAAILVCVVFLGLTSIIILRAHL